MQHDVNKAGAVSAKCSPPSCRTISRAVNSQFSNVIEDAAGKWNDNV